MPLIMILFQIPLCSSPTIALIYPNSIHKLTKLVRLVKE